MKTKKRTRLPFIPWHVSTPNSVKQSSGNIGEFKIKYMRKLNNIKSHADGLAYKNTVTNLS